MKKLSTSPLLIALITFSMIASSVSSSVAFGATTPAQEQAAKDKAAAEKAAAEKAAQEAQARARAQQQAQQEAQARAQQQAQQQAAQQKAQQEAQARAQQQAQQQAAQQKAQQEAQARAQQQAQQQAAQKAQQEAQAKQAKDSQDKAAQAQKDAQTRAQQQKDAQAKQAKEAQDKAAQAQKDAQATKDKDAKVKADADAKAKADQASKVAQAKQTKDSQDKAAQATKDAQAAKDKAAKDAQSKANQEAKMKDAQGAADKARADKAARDAQDKASRKPAPQNPIGTAPVLQAKQEDKATVADKLKTAQNQTPAQAAHDRAQKDQASQKLAQAAAAASVDPKVKADQKAKEDAAQKAADEKAKQIAAQKAQEKKAIQASLPPPPPKTQQQVAAQVQQKAKAKDNVAQPAKTAEVKKQKEIQAAATETATVQKKEVVSEQKDKAVVAKQSADIKKISQNPTAQLSAAQAQVIAQNKKQMDARTAAKANKPVVVAPVHSSPFVELKTVNGQRIGLDPQRPVKIVVPVKVVVKPVIVVGGVQVPSHMAYPETQTNIHNANIRSENIHNTIINRTDVKSVYITNNITNVTNVYVNNYQNVVVERSRVYNNYYYQPQHTYTQYYSSYYDHGFRGGYAYPVRVDIAIHEHFWNPVVLWMYDDSDHTDFYCQYYGNSYCYSYPIRPFRYARVYYPTDTMRDLAIEVSGMEYYRHTYYRTALEVLTDKLNAQISNYVSGRFYFGPNDIVINHYRNIGGGQVIVEGFVDRGDLHVAFKGHLDLENPYNSDVFVPTVSEYSPVATGIAILNAIVALETAADVRENVSPNVVYEEPAPPPLPIVNVTCQTFSGDFKGSGAAADSGSASQSAIAQCSSQNGANATECTSNLSCDDGVSYSPIVSCSTSSTDANGNVVSFVRNGRDADYASQMVQQICIADDTTNDVDACSSADNVTCVALDNSILNPMMCSVTVPNAANSFNFQSFDTDKARNRAISNCVTADGTDVDDCNNTDNLSCDYVNAPAPVALTPTCTSTGPNGQTYASGPASDYKSAYNIAVKSCTRANPTSFGICESSAAISCPGYKN